MTVSTMTFRDYATIDAVNWSTLKEMGRSPLHYAHRREQARADNASLLRGRLVHTAVLEPDRLPLEWAVFDGERRAGKAWEDFKSANTNRGIVKLDEYAEAIAIRDAVRAHPIAAQLLASGRPELTVTWTDEATGLPCKGRADWVCDVPGLVSLVDLKTTRDLDMRRFGSVAARFGYHAQLAWYLRGLRANGVEVDVARIVAVEAEPPHDVGVFVLDDGMLYAGDEECTEMLARVKACRDSGEWRGRYEREVPLELPAWWYAQEEEDAGLGVSIRGAA